MASDGERYGGTETVFGRRENTVYRSALGTIGPEAGAIFDRMTAAAGLTWTMLTMGWERRRRPHEGLDMEALFGALHLDASCREAHATPNAFLHPNTNQLRYELYAATLAVQALLPVPADERPALLQTVTQHLDRGERRWRAEPGDLAEPHATLVADWRQWLRSDGIKRAPVGAELHGEASILAAAAHHIQGALNPGRAILPGYEPEDVLVLPVEAEPWRHWPVA